MRRLVFAIAAAPAMILAFGASVARAPRAGGPCEAMLAACEKAASTKEAPIAATAHEPEAQGAAAKPPADGRRPNIIFILTDDLAWNLVPYMSHVRKMQQDGVTFANAFVTDSLCCPSRASIFTGRYPHDTGIYRNTGDDGGYLGFHRRGLERASFAVALSATGYRTAMLGKYLNGYEPGKHPAEPGWTTWTVAGRAYREFNYSLNRDGKVHHYGQKRDDYLTDVLSKAATHFVKQSAGTPFFLEVATFAPHAPYTPAPRDATTFPGLRAPRSPAFNAAPQPNAPHWLLPYRDRALSKTDIAEIDGDFRKRAQSVLAIDAMIGALQAAVAAIGAEKNTYFIFSSDNGLHMGEHRLMPGKMTAFDSDIRVPLIVTGPGVPADLTIQEIVENIDLNPTFTELAGASGSAAVDGHSLAPLLHGRKPPRWRTLALVEHHHGPDEDAADPDAPARRSGNPPSYEAIRSRSFLYVEYEDGDKEHYDLAADPNELHNNFTALSAGVKKALHETLTAAAKCHDAKSCQAAERPTESLTKR
ncbi:MAG TPA: sulfatase-like hydrolase/transferase [Verrucomicrobiae bacterium]|nr:sulfatase-like hydrolase/transferase [Verrucomicrobiae bacterium]